MPENGVQEEWKCQLLSKQAIKPQKDTHLCDYSVCDKCFNGCNVAFRIIDCNEEIS